MDEKKIRTGISISAGLLNECDRYAAEGNAESRSELIETALKFYFATREIGTKSDVLVPELAESIAAASDHGITKISKGLFRYAVELDMLIRLLSDTLEYDESELREIRYRAINDVRKMKGRVNLDTLIAE
ncbi:MAG: hypothetical protein IKK53_03975 [Ruminiclostridium sp.]|nr:hypothetical protein [Ruminiclostridium sp.]